MGFMDSFSHLGDSYDEVNNAGHKASVTHEALSAAVAYQAMKAYENHVAKNGKPDSHAKAKEVIAGFIGATADHFIETRGLDFIDKQKAKHAAHEHVDEVIVTEYQQ